MSKADSETWYTLSVPVLLQMSKADYETWYTLSHDEISNEVNLFGRYSVHISTHQGPIRKLGHSFSFMALIFIHGGPSGANVKTVASIELCRHSKLLYLKDCSSCMFDYHPLYLLKHRTDQLLILRNIILFQ